MHGKFNCITVNFDRTYNLYQLEFHYTSIYRDLTTVYTNENWFVILLSRIYFSDWVTKIRHYSPLKTNNKKTPQNPTIMGYQVWGSGTNLGPLVKYLSVLLFRHSDPARFISTQSFACLNNFSIKLNNFSTILIQSSFTTRTPNSELCGWLKYFENFERVFQNLENILNVLNV